MSEAKTFDFRSDTVTVPTSQMLAAMCSVEVGDDVKNEDPTIHKLQNHVASLCDKESGLFVCSGVMSNQLAIRTHVTFLGAEKPVAIQQVICDFRSHIFQHELGGISYHSQSQVMPINPLLFGKKYLTADLIENHLFLGNDLHTPITTIVCIENTLGGQVIPLEEIKKIRQLCDKHGIVMHVDGARLWNASVASGVSLKEYGSYFDSLSLCLSKGLGAPIGSVLVGNKKFIEKAKQYRKLFGGGWRQAGLLAGAGLYAIEHNWQRMAEDHKNAEFLYHELVNLGFTVAEKPHTNIVYADCTPLGLTWDQIIEQVHALQANQTEHKKVLLEQDSKSITRFVTHLQTPKEGVERLVQLLKGAITQLKK